ncbi:lantibiotic dehydratase [Dactylosporangium vinaceum]|uniref:Lantibiotic dehydratase n=1 Tax=Dactylosporangium vinaceum TaxID=53362 RepID=A0ABV5M2P0_9ACTN|nr:lantibiotic dehydratase [Dactylosporangium vinaceum]UAB96341.1 lantibiotic dehydratase [Dactylosporangium vinaceum]
MSIIEFGESGMHRRWYQSRDTALLRASTHLPDAGGGEPWPAAGNADRLEVWVGWLGKVWQDRRIVESVAVSSPVFAEQITAAVDGGGKSDAARVRRLAVSLGRYLARMRGRATPFGLFAGVTPLGFAATGSLLGSEAHRTWVRADAAWLAEVVTRLEAYPQLLARLSVVGNGLAEIRGGRVTIPGTRVAQARFGAGRHEVSVIYSAAVRDVLRAATAPVVVADLVRAVFPADAAAASAMLQQLVAHGVLITNLRPPSTTVDGLAHVLDQLAGVDADGIEEVEALMSALREARTAVRMLCQTHWLDGGGRHAVAARLRRIAEVPQPLMTDVRLDCTATLPRRVATEAAAAASALTRLAPHPEGDPAWCAYRQRFLDRFGLGAVVPLLDMVDPVRGIGFPDHFVEPANSAPTARSGQLAAPAGLTVRNERLLVLAQLAVLDGADEVVLNETAIDAVTADGPAPRPVPHLDLCFDLRAASLPDVGVGRFALGVTGIGRTALATGGRFFDIVHEVPAAVDLPVVVLNGEPVQLSFPALDARGGNVLRAPRLLPQVLPVGEHRERDTDIDLRDLAVTGDPDRLCLLSLSRRRVIEPVLANAAARHAMAPLVRLLAELPTAWCTPMSLLDWGAADVLPFRPRLRYGRSILSPARWRISPADLPAATAAEPVWEKALDRLRERLQLPAWVYVGTGDQRLRLHLDEPMDRALLRGHLHRTADQPVLTEAPTPEDHRWFGGRAHEILLPLATTLPPAPPPVVLRGHADLHPFRQVQDILPGDTILSAKLYGPAELAGAILTEHLPRLLAAWSSPPLWWFIRYEDPAPHLRLRLHRVEYGLAAERIGAWAADLRRLGLLADLALVTYRPETGRFGTGEAMAAAEAFFAADSAAAVAELAAGRRLDESYRQALTAASLVDLAAAVSGGEANGLRWLLDHPDLAASQGRTDRIALAHTITLTDANTGPAALAAFVGGAEVLEMWQARRDAAAAYAAQLEHPATHVTSASVLTALLHLHHVRVHGITPALEARTHRLARAAALARTARTGDAGRSRTAS